jgi:hypothetical protein
LVVAAFVAVIVQVPAVDAVKTALAVALLNEHPLAVPFVTAYVTAPVSEPPMVEKLGVAVKALPFQVADEVTCEAVNVAWFAFETVIETGVAVVAEL